MSSHVTHRNESRHTQKWIMSHPEMSHVSHFEQSSQECTASQIGQETAWHDSTAQNVRHDSFLCETWFISLCDVTHFYAWHDLTYQSARHDSLLQETSQWDRVANMTVLGEWVWCASSVAEMIVMWLFCRESYCYVDVVLQKLLVCGEHDSVGGMSVMWLFCCENYCYVDLLLQKLLVCGEHDSEHVLLRT